MGLPASPPATSEDSEGDSDSPASRVPSSLSSSFSAPTVPIPIQYSAPVEPPTFNPQLIRIDEHTMQLHFTPLYFGKQCQVKNQNKKNALVSFDSFYRIIGCNGNNEKSSFGQ